MIQSYSALLMYYVRSTYIQYYVLHVTWANDHDPIAWVCRSRSYFPPCGARHKINLLFGHQVELQHTTIPADYDGPGYCIITHISAPF